MYADTENLQERIKIGLANLEKELQDPNSKELIFEQYKMLVSSAHTIEERRKDSNTIFIGINSIFTPFLIKFYEIKDLHAESLILFALLIMLGIFICIDWLRIINSYKSLNQINLTLIRTFEKYLPASVFSLRAAMLTSGNSSKKANVILEKESIIPKLFIAVYLLYFVIKILFFKL